MKIETKLVEFVTHTRYEELPHESTEFVKRLMLGVIGTGIGGVAQDSVENIVQMAKNWAGGKEATIWVYNEKVSAHAAAFVNSIMARTLDYDDELNSGAHSSASVVSAALAAAEMTDGCTGKEFLAAVTLGSEVAAKLDLCSSFDGFDPTGIVAVFGATAAVGKILGLDSKKMLAALALAFNRCAGSLQCKIDGALAVRAVQGFVSQGAIMCVQLAQAGITGPSNFIEGIYGYNYLYGRDIVNTAEIMCNLGIDFDFHGTIVKRYPSSACTLCATEAALELIEVHRFSPEEVSRIDIRITPYCNSQAGFQFKIAYDPRVEAQANIRYCVANAILRRDSKLPHFEERYVRDTRIRKLVQKCFVISDPNLQGVHPERSLAAEVSVTTRAGDVHNKFVKSVKGMPGNPFTEEEYIERFEDCMQYARKPISHENVGRIVSSINGLEEMENVCDLIPLLAGSEA